MAKRYARKRIGPLIELVPMCPLCRASIYWTMYSGREGTRSEAYCANNTSATRLIVDPKNMRACQWAGYAIRNKNGAVDIFSIDGGTVPHKVIRHDKVSI